MQIVDNYKTFITLSLSLCLFLYLATYVYFFPKFSLWQNVQFTDNDVDYYPHFDCTKIFCNITQLLFQCMDHKAVAVLSRVQIFHWNIIPLDSSVTKCVTITNQKSSDSQVVKKVYKFGLLPVVSEDDDRTIFGLKNITNNGSNCTNKLETDKILLLKCRTFYIKLILLDKNDDYWMGVDFSLEDYSTTWNFAVKNLNMQNVIVNNVSFVYPLDTYTYHLHLGSSRMLTCNYHVAAKLRDEFPGFYNVSSTLTVVNFRNFVAFRNLLHSLRMLPFLISGSLLGWIRECGVIPFTTDFDIAIRENDYNDDFENVIINHKNFKILNRYNQIDYYLSYAILDRTDTKTDLFVLYQESNGSYYGGIGPGRTILKWSFPQIGEICTADLFGFLFHVPCNTMDFILADYGQNWTRPVHDSNFKWYKSSYAVSVVKNCTEEEWANVVKYY